jgi:hypothetical protein
MDRRGDRDGESSWLSLGERLQSLKELIMENTFPQDCVLYTLGHQTHFIQTRVKADLPRFPATVELIDLETIAI